MQRVPALTYEKGICSSEMLMTSATLDVLTKYRGGVSLVVQWLRLCSFCSFGMAKTKKNKKKQTQKPSMED